MKTLVRRLEEAKVPEEEIRAICARFEFINHEVSELAKGYLGYPFGNPAGSEGFPLSGEDTMPIKVEGGVAIKSSTGKPKKSPTKRAFRREPRVVERHRGRNRGREKSE